VKQILPVFLACAPLLSWGAKGHQLAAALAVRDLPAGPKAWLQSQEAFVSQYAPEPDHWRNQDRKEASRHYLNTEVYGGPDRVPHNAYLAMVAISPKAFQRAGQLPWIIQDRYGDLVQAFRQGDKQRVALVTSILSHYVADAQVPLHTTEDYDGLDKASKGIHGRWETGLVERYIELADLQVRTVKADGAPKEAPWAWIQESHALIGPLMSDDREASSSDLPKGRSKRRGGSYWTIFQELQGPVVRAQLQKAGERTAMLVMAAWQEAGRPLPAP
jgi:hypothetical protein